MLSLAGIDIPLHMQGKAFLGEQQAESSDYVHLFRGRMDERIDNVRAVRDKQFRYIKNYMPHRIYGQYIEYLWRAPSCRSWEEAYLAGKCNEAQSAFWNEKPAEELYDVRADPWEVNNLADDPAYSDVLERMRKETNRWMGEIRDTGLMPEGEMSIKNQEEPSYTYVHSGSYDFDKIKYAADVATLREVKNLDKLIGFLGDENGTVRYWGAIGCLILKDKSQPAKSALIAVLNDESVDVRIAAAEALCHLGEEKVATIAFIEALNSDNMMVRVHAMNSLEIIGGDVAKAAIPKVKEVIGSREGRDYDIRAGKRLIEVYGG
jgi:hypothetical protein